MTTQNIYDMTDTWNDAGTTFSAIKMNVTDTASQDLSLLLSLQVGSANQLSLTKTGVLQIGDSAGNFEGLLCASIAIGTGTGKNYLATGQINLYASSLNVSSMNNISFQMRSVSYYGISSTVTSNGTNDVRIYRDDVGVLAQRYDTTLQTKRIYNTWASSTDYHRLAITSASAVLSSVSGATATASSLIPAGAVVVGVTTKIETALGNGNGTTGFAVGLSGDPNQFGDQSAITENATTDNTDWTATTIQIFNAATDVILTAAGGNFDGTGDVHVKVHYLIGEAD